jgi:hypothetical protein
MPRFVSKPKVIDGIVPTEPNDLATKNYADSLIEYGPTEPENIEGVWFDTTEEGTSILPLGGLENQVLAKSSDLDYDVDWKNLPYYIGDMPPESPVVGDIWLDTSEG